MNTLTSTLDNPSAHATTPNRILHAFLAAWWRGNVVEAAEQFRDRFTFTDHALGLEFKDKERSTELLAKASPRRIRTLNLPVASRQMPGRQPITGSPS